MSHRRELSQQATRIDETAQSLRVGLAQLGSSVDKSENLHRIEEIAVEAASQGVDLLVLPEASMQSFPVRGALVEGAESLDGPWMEVIARSARALGLVIVVGIFEAVPNEARVYNTVVAVGESGELGFYRKIHLFDALGERESEAFLRGGGHLLRFEIGGIRIAAITCYDLRFPELARQHAMLGCDLLVVPSAWYAGPLKEDHWLTLARARAVENTTYVAAVSQPPPKFVGRSCLIDPLGVVTTDAGESEGLVVGVVNTKRLSSARSRLPVLEHIQLLDPVPQIFPERLETTLLPR